MNEWTSGYFAGVFAASTVILGYFVWRPEAGGALAFCTSAATLALWLGVLSTRAYRALRGKS
jgi:hypothetical protein